MSTYNGRHGPNVSAYLRDLNTISPHDTTATAPEDSFNMEDDLALFTNTQFFDFDSGQNTDFQAQPVKIDVDTVTRHNSTASGDVTPAQTSIGDLPKLDFMSSDFNFTDFSEPYAAPPMNGFQQGFQPLQPSHVQMPHQQPQFRQGNVAANKANSEIMPSATVAAPTPVGQHMNYEETSRVAAEEDKRRRNTAASARFRIKKKQREQALEKSAKEMSEKVNALENRISQLETENKWLKNLLVEKNEGSDDITSLWKEFTKHAAEKTKAVKVDSSSRNESAQEDR
ncbi:hypothetical protein E4U09_007742 [Claviceps aff. purpurea]|uniref:BZIP domain-containing protein n=1 Tax=Claviceps aff. purpurea TaxID=1967640 RepID=A0A9P7QMI7_9HYPO|nr:hypothetical protein E4U09_007742 [Claviceps aff. purpurea]